MWPAAVQIVAMACLLLASKSEDIPKRLVEIIRECWQARHDKRHDAHSKPDDKVLDRLPNSALDCSSELTWVRSC